MPGKNGAEMCRIVREKWPMAILFAVTGYSSLFELSACRDAGFEDYFTKPVDVDQILAAYEKISSAPESDLPRPATVPSLARVEWEHIQRVLTDCSGNVSQAAKLLGLHRRSLQRKLLKFPPRT